MAYYRLPSRDLDGLMGPARREERRETIRRYAAGEAPIPMERSSEYSSRIIEACETDRPIRINGNVANTGLITNLPPGCVVEVPCLVDGTGVHPCYVGDLPGQLAGLNRANVAVQELAVKAALEGITRRSTRRWPDPLTAATCRSRDPPHGGRDDRGAPALDAAVRASRPTGFGGGPRRPLSRVDSPTHPRIVAPRHDALAGPKGYEFAATGWISVRTAQEPLTSDISCGNM